MISVKRRSISPEEAAVVRRALEVGPIGGDRTGLLESIDRLFVVRRCPCGCVTVYFEAPAGDRPGFDAADAVGLSPSGSEVGVTVWANDHHIHGLEVYDFGDNANRHLPLPESLKPFP